MKKIRLFAAVIAALVVIFISLYAMLNGRSGDNSSQTEAPATKTVVVATREIPAYSVITPSMVQTTEVPTASSNNTAFGDVNDVVGAVSLGTIVTGEVLLPNHLRVQSSNGVAVALGLEEGYRAMSLSVTDETGVSKLLRVGNNVDVIFVADDPDKEGSEAVMLLENIRILALDQLTAEPKPAQSNAAAAVEEAEDAAAEASPEPETPVTVNYAYITLQVKPDDAVKLAAAHQDGVIYLTLRSQDEKGTIGQAKVSSIDLL